MADRLKNKVAIVTGAGSVGPGVGNGKASAILYARESARVVLVDLNLDAARETERIIREERGICTAVAADVTKAADCARVVETCVLEHGGADILHNNVGVTKAGGPVEQSEEDWMQKRDGGSIVSISSLPARRRASPAAPPGTEEQNEQTTSSISRSRSRAGHRRTA